jgi:hypothetical protein
MQSVIKLINVWDNPVFHRFRRSQLRAKRAIFWYLATLIITTFVISLTYIIQTNSFDMSEEAAARNQWISLLVIQGLIVLLKGTGRTSAGPIQDKIDETLDYQRLTPVTPLRNLIGYLFGLPILEYTMFALTLPHLAFVVMKGNIPLGTVFSVYLVFFVCAIFYHMTAIAVGMVMKRWIWGYLLSIFSVAFLNLFLPTLASQLGLKFLQYLSIFPVIGQKVMPLMVLRNNLPQPPGPPFAPGPGRPGGADFGSPQQDFPFLSFADPVPFFDWMISPFWFTLMLQLGLIVTFTSMAVRRWQKANRHSLSKPYALGMLAVFIVLVIGNLWPAITGEYLPFALFGTRDLNQLGEVIAIGLPLVYSIAVWLLCIFLYFNVVPTHQDYVRGVRRARKLERMKARPWEDDSASLAFMSLFAVVSLLGYWAIYGTMMDAGFMAFLDGADYAHWRLPLVLAMVLIYSLLLLQVFESRGVVLSALVLWLLPILVAIVSAAAIEDVTRFQTVIASLSPLATVLMTGILPSGWAAGFGAESEIATLLTGANTGLVLLIAQTAFLGYRWRQLRLELL